MKRKKATWRISRVRGSKKIYPAINLQKILKEAGFEINEEVVVEWKEGEIQIKKKS